MDISQIPVSTVPAVKAYLLSAITAAVDDASVLVCYGEPGSDVPNDVISIGDTERKLAPTQLVGSGGAGWLFEDYEQTVVVSAAVGGEDTDTQQQADERAYQLLALVEAAVRVDPSLGGLVNTAYPTSSTSESGAVANDEGTPYGMGCDITLKITVEPNPQ